MTSSGWQLGLELNCLKFYVEKCVFLKYANLVFSVLILLRQQVYFVCTFSIFKYEYCVKITDVNVS